MAKRDRRGLRALEPPRTRRLNLPLLPQAMLAVAVAAAYWSGLHAPFQFDDVDAVVENVAIRHWWPFARGLPTAVQVAGRPIVALSYALNFPFAGVDPFGYRVVNLVIHAACAWLLFAIVRILLSRSRWTHQARAIATGIALLWAVHPLNVGTITYVSARSEALASLACLGVLYASLRAHGARHPRAWSAGAVALCAIGMATKETMVTAPVLVLLFDRAFYAPSFTTALRDRRALYAGLAATWGVLAAVAWSAPRAASAGFNVGISPWTYLLNQGPVLTDYLRTAFWPHRFVFTYGEPLPLAFASAAPWLAVIVLLLALCVWAWIRAPKVGALGIAFFLLLAPTSTIVPIATEVGAERRMYLPLASLIALVVVAAVGVVERLIAPRAAATLSRIGAVTVAVVAILLIALTSRRNAEYLTEEALWRSTVASWPSAVAHRNLATSLKLAGKQEEALGHFRIAAAEHPEVRRIVGQELFELGRFDEAIDELRSFLATADRSTESARAARFLIGRSEVALGRTTRAADEFDTIVQARPNDEAALLALADARLQLAQFGTAVEAYRRYTSLQPDNPHALINFGISLLSLGDTAYAVETLRRATELAPADANAHRNLAVALAGEGDLPAAADHAARAVSLAPGEGSGHELLGRILLSRGRTGEGQQELARARTLAGSATP